MSQPSAKITRVLFVCTGNICRSPTAEAVFRKLVDRAGQSDRITCASAGTHASSGGHGADSRSIAAAAERGYDLSNHQPRRVRDRDFAEYDYVVAMDRANIATMRGWCPPALAFRLSLLLSFATSDAVVEVPDPYMGDAGFERVLDLIEDASKSLLDHVVRMQDGTTQG